MSDTEIWGGPWTAKKVAVVGDYLDNFQIALKNTNFKTIYVDALAGDGTWRETSSDLDLPWDSEAGALDGVSKIREGIAQRALGTAPAFDRYLFNDLDLRKSNKLREIARSRGINPKKIETSNTDANTFVEKIIRSIDRRHNRGVVLLDPWGMQVHWSTIETIAQVQCLELWYLFPTQAVLRMLPHSGPKSEWRNTLTNCLGTSDWEREFYRSIFPPNDLFGPREEELLRDATFDSVEGFVVRRLESVFAGTVLTQPLRLGPSGNAFFSLCFASGNPDPKARSLTEKLSQGVIRANRGS